MDLPKLTEIGRTRCPTVTYLRAQALQHCFSALTLPLREGELPCLQWKELAIKKGKKPNNIEKTCTRRKLMPI